MRLYVKTALWGCCVLFFDSSAVHPEEKNRNVPCNSHTQILWLDALRQKRRFLMPVPVLPCRFHQVCNVIVLVLAYLVQIVNLFFFVQVPLTQSHVVLELVMCQERKR